METPTVDREQLRRLVCGQLPAEETAAVCALVSSDPAVARAYVEVKLENDLQNRRECAPVCSNANAASEGAASSAAVTPAEPQTDVVPQPTAPSVAPLAPVLAAAYFVLAAIVGFALMGLVVSAWSTM